MGYEWENHEATHLVSIIRIVALARLSNAKLQNAS